MLIMEKKKQMETLGPASIIQKTRRARRNKQVTSKDQEVELSNGMSLKNNTINARAQAMRSRFTTLEEELMEVIDDNDGKAIMESEKSNVHGNSCSLAHKREEEDN